MRKRRNIKKLYIDYELKIKKCSICGEIKPFGQFYFGEYEQIKYACIDCYKRGNLLRYYERVLKKLQEDRGSIQEKSAKEQKAERAYQALVKIQYDTALNKSKMLDTKNLD